LECFPDWEEFCECKNDTLKFVNPISHNVHSTLKCSQNWDKFCKYESNALEFTIPLSPNQIFIIFLSNILYLNPSILSLGSQAVEMPAKFLDPGHLFTQNSSPQN
jgi:hypothetical protein